MTPKERAKSSSINGSRRKQLPGESGTFGPGSHQFAESSMCRPADDEEHEKHHVGKKLAAEAIKLPKSILGTNLAGEQHNAVSRSVIPLKFKGFTVLGGGNLFGGGGQSFETLIESKTSLYRMSLSTTRRRPNGDFLEVLGHYKIRSATPSVRYQPEIRAQYWIAQAARAPKEKIGDGRRLLLKTHW